MEKISFSTGKAQEYKKDVREPRTLKSVFLLFLPSFICSCEVIERGKDRLVEEMDGVYIEKRAGNK